MALRCTRVSDNDQKNFQLEKGMVEVYSSVQALRKDFVDDTGCCNPFWFWK